jgi:hypothetical protein
VSGGAQLQPSLSPSAFILHLSIRLRRHVRVKNRGADSATSLSQYGMEMRTVCRNTHAMTGDVQEIEQAIQSPSHREVERRPGLRCLLGLTRPYLFLVVNGLAFEFLPVSVCPVNSNRAGFAIR